MVFMLIVASIYLTIINRKDEFGRRVHQRCYGRTLYTTSCSRTWRTTTFRPKSSFGLTSVRRRMINLERLNPLAQIGGVSADVDYVADAQRTRLEPQDRDRQVTVIVVLRHRYAPRWSGLRGRLGIGRGCRPRFDRGVRGRLGFLGDERRTSAFFAAFFLAAVFLRVVALVTGGFLRFALVLPLAIFLVGIWSLPPRSALARVQVAGSGLQRCRFAGQDD